MSVRSALLAAALGALAAPAIASAQIGGVAHATYTGTIDYVVSGATLRPNSDNANPCAVTGQGKGTLSGIPAGASIVGAWLYWGGSGAPDLQVQFQGSSVTATRNWTATIPGTPLDFFGGARDVTGLVSGNGAYALSSLDVEDGGLHCDAQLVVAGWGLVVVYSSPGLPVRTVELRDGLGVLMQGSSSVALGDFGPSTAARISVLVWDADAGAAGNATNPEAIFFNGTQVSAGNNAFDNTISSSGSASEYGLDFDSFDVSPLLAQNGAAVVRISTGGDLVLPQLLVSAIDAGLVDVTPEGLATPVVRLGGARYSQQFLVENQAATTEGFDLVARVAGAGVVVVDSIRAAGGIGVAARPDSLRVSIGARATTAVLVWYTMPPGVSGDDVLHLLARSTRLPTQAWARDEGWAELRRAAPILTMTKQVSPDTDVRPGMDLTYTMSVANGGGYAATDVVVNDQVPAELDFRLGSVSSSLPAGMTAVVSYSTDGTTWTYVPTAGGCGAEAAFDRCVRAVRWTLGGVLAPGGTQTAALSFVARLR